MITLRQGDCLELMRDIPDGYVDLVVTSPPYDNLRSYNGNIDQWCFEKFQAIARELHRVVKDGGVVVWIVNDATIKGSETGSSFKQALYFKECGFNLHDTMIWEKSSAPYPETTRYYPAFEYMFVLSKGRPRATNLIQDRKNKYAGTPVHGTERRINGSTVARSAVKNKTGRRVKEYGARFNVWSIAEEKRNNTGHPAVFPEKLAEDHIVSWSNPGDVVMDVFMGSGTTGVACVNTGRQFIGMELDSGYFEIAQKRVDEALKEKEMSLHGVH